MKYSKQKPFADFINQMRIIDLKIEKEERVVEETISVLRSGGLVIYPTETCYGIGADVTNQKAVEKVFQFKGERKGKPILIAVADQKMAEDYVEINQTAKNLYQNFLPGPVAVVSRSKGKVVPWVESANHTLGIRITGYPLILNIIGKFGKPITSTSANTSGKKSPYSLQDIQKYTSKKGLALVDLILDAGRIPLRPTSTVVDTTLNEPTILRQGEIIIDDIPNQAFTSNSESETKSIAGQIFDRYKNLLSTKPIIFALQGELGSGKTQFVKGLAQSLQITGNVPSPTFILAREYPYESEGNSGTLYHVDTWRMEKPEELEDLGIAKMLKPGNIIAIEWLQKVRNVLEEIQKQKKAHVVWVNIDYLSLEKRRIKYQI